MNVFMMAALEYEAKGFSVIPLKPEDKVPLIPSWDEYQYGRADREQIGQWWRTWKNANIGIVTGAISGIFVIDTDSREAAAELKPLLGNMDHVGIVTTGKGFHLYYKHGDKSYPNKAGIKPHVDFRGDGGYVVAPPSIHPSGKPYEWCKAINGKLRELPAAFIQLMTEPAYQNGAKPRFDTAQALAGFPEGQRDQELFRLACKLRGADVPYDVALELCETAAANCIPPFREAKRKVDQAYRYSPGHRPQPQPNLQESFWPSLRTASDALIATPDLERWLWHRVFPVGSCSMLVAKPKVGKSSLAVSLSIAIARGVPFLGRETKRAPVIYLFLDGSVDDIKEQFAKAGLASSDPLYWYAGTIPNDGIKWATEMIGKAGAKFIVVDTLQKFFRFRDLNDYAEIANSMEPMLRAIQEAEAHLLFLHHAAKFAQDDMDAAIGSSVLKGQAYANLHLKKLADSEIRILRSEQRGGKNFDEVSVGFNGPEGTGLMVVTGTRTQAEIRAVEPLIRESIEKSEDGMTEGELRESIQGRGMLVSMAIREMSKRGELETTGLKRSRNNPLRYHLAQVLGNPR